jgi:hypothetical protein
MLLANRPAFARVERGAGFGGKPRREARRFLESHPRDFAVVVILPLPRPAVRRDYVGV